MHLEITTSRLLLEPLTVNDNSFIRELVNTEGWIKFIGNRNINSPDDATAYIQKIISNPDIQYWVVILKGTETPIGIVTYIKRDYLEHPDIGFSFLPAFAGKGYAYEAAKEVLNFVKEKHHLSKILATTIPENINSIRLLKKLGLQFDKEIEVETEKLHVYSGLL